MPAHSDKEVARGKRQGRLRLTPLGAWLENTREALTRLLPPGNAGSIPAADHLTVADWALTQLSERWRGKPILIRADGVGLSHAPICALSANGAGVLGRLPRQPRHPARPTHAWQVASNVDELLREHADVVEVTGPLNLSGCTKTCPDMRVIVRREVPHPGATLDAFEIRDCYRYQAFATNTATVQLAFLEARHRAHAHVEDHTRTGKDTGLRHLPKSAPDHQRGLDRTRLMAADLLALTQTNILMME